MQPLSHSSQGNTYTIKWMFGLPEVLNAMHNMDIHEGSTIQVLKIQKAEFHEKVI